MYSDDPWMSWLSKGLRQSKGDRHKTKNVYAREE